MARSVDLGRAASEKHPSAALRGAREGEGGPGGGRRPGGEPPGGRRRGGGRGPREGGGRGAPGGGRGRGGGGGPRAPAVTAILGGDLDELIERLRGLQNDECGH